MAYTKEPLWYINVPRKITSKEYKKRFKQKYSDFIKEYCEIYLKRREMNIKK